MRTAISPKRFVPDEREYRMIVFHFPPINSIVAVTGQLIFLFDIATMVTIWLLLFSKLLKSNQLQIQTIISYFA